MKKILTLALAIGCGAAMAQKSDNVGIGTTKPDPSALLDLNSNSKGFLLPRMSEAQRNAIKSPAIGLMIFQTDQTIGTYTYDGTTWQPSNARTAATQVAGAWDKQGNAIDATDFLGSTNNFPLRFRTNNVERMQVTADGNLVVANTGYVVGNIINQMPRTFLGALDPANMHWFASSSNGSEPSRVAFGIKANPGTFAVEEIRFAPAGSVAMTVFPTSSGSVNIGPSTVANPYNVKLFVDGATVIGQLPSVTTLTGAGTPSGFNLYVANGILTEKVKVSLQATAWADYVFDPKYNLMPLEDVEKYIVKNKHLPNVASAEELSKEGLDLTKTSAKLMEKIEELTLYIIEMNKEMKILKDKVARSEK